jgi:hypothetical protein
MGAIPRRPLISRPTSEASHGLMGATSPRQGDVASVSAVVSSNLVWAVARGLGLRRLGRLHWPGSSGAVPIWVGCLGAPGLSLLVLGRGCRPRVPGVPFRSRRPRGWRPCGFVPPAGRAGLSVRCGTYPDAGSECQKFPVLRRGGCGIPRSVRGPWSGRPVDDREVTYSWSPEPLLTQAWNYHVDVPTASLWSS